MSLEREIRQRRQRPGITRLSLSEKPRARSGLCPGIRSLEPLGERGVCPEPGSCRHREVCSAKRRNSSLSSGKVMQSDGEDAARGVGRRIGSPGKEERNAALARLCRPPCPAPRSRAAPSLCAQRDTGLAFAVTTKSGPKLLLCPRERRRSGAINPARSSPWLWQWGHGRGGSADPLDLIEV